MRKHKNEFTPIGFLLAACILFAVTVCAADENPKDTLVAENSSCQMHFDRATGGLRGVYSKASQKWVVSPGEPKGLFALSLKGPGMGPETQKRRLEAGSAKLLEQTLDGGARAILRQRYLLPDGKSTVSIQADFVDGVPYSTWQITLENHTGMDIYEVEFPVISGVSKLAGGELMLRGGGYHIQTDPFRFGSLRDAFPSRVPFPVLDIYAAQGGGGLFLVDQDASRQRTEICTAGSTRSMFLIKTIRIADGETRHLQATPLFGVHSGDWHYAAGLYRDFLARSFPQPKLPEWVKHCHGSYQQGWGPRPRFSDIPYWAAAMKEESGLKFITYGNIVSRWGLGVWAPHLGTEEDLRMAARKLRRNRLYIQYYSLANSLHPASDPTFLLPRPDVLGSFKHSAFPAQALSEPGLCSDGTIKRLDGSVIFEWTPLKGPFDLSQANRERMFNNPGDIRVCLELPMAHRHFMKMAEQRAAVGQDSFYWDTVGCGNHVCFDPTHGHGYGGYAEGEAQWLRKCWDIDSAANPDAMFLSESVNVTTGVLHGFTSATHAMPSVVRYVAPSLVGFIGNGNHPKDLLGVLLESFRCGMRLSGFNSWWDSPQETAVMRYNPGLLALRQAVFEYVYPANFLDDVGASVSNPQIRVGQFVRPGTGVVTVVNRQGLRNVRVTLSSEEYQSAKFAYAVRWPEGRFTRFPFEHEAGKLVFTAPTEVASAILFLEKPLLQLQARATNLAPGGRGEVVVTVRNLSPEAANGEVALELPADWPGVRSQPFRLQDELECAELRFAIQAPPQTKTGRHAIYAVAGSGGQKVRRWELCFVEEPVRVELTQYHLDWVRAQITNLTDSPQTIELDIRARKPFIFAGYSRKLELNPGEHRTLEFPIDGLAEAQEPCRVEVCCAAPSIGWQDSFVETFWPLIANGNLEMNRFTDILPDYWWVANPEKSPFPKQEWFHWTKEGGYGGQGRALMLDGGERHQFVLAGVGPLKPGMTYRLSARMKATLPKDVSLECVGVIQHREANTYQPLRTTVSDGRNFTAELRLPQDATPDSWQECTTIFTVPSHLKLFSSYKGFATLSFTNPTPDCQAWIDNVRLVPYQP